MNSEIKKGLIGVISDETKISEVMPDINSLTYRGYTVQELCEKCNFEEVAYLILNNDLPNKDELTKFKKDEKNNRKISDSLKSIIKNYPKKAHPMDTTQNINKSYGIRRSRYIK